MRQADVNNALTRLGFAVVRVTPETPTGHGYVVTPHEGLRGGWQWCGIDAARIMRDMAGLNVGCAMRCGVTGAPLFTGTDAPVVVGTFTDGAHAVTVFTVRGARCVAITGPRRLLAATRRRIERAARAM